MEEYRNISEASLVHEKPLEGHNGVVPNEVIDNNVTCEDSIGFSEDLAKCEDFMAMFATPETLPSKLFDVSGQTIETASLQSSVKMEIADENSHNEDSKTNVLTGNFQIDKYSIPCIPKEEQDHELQGLGVCVYDQTEFEEEVMGQVDKALKREDEKQRKQEVEKELNAVSDDIRFAKQRLGHLDKALAMAPKDEKLMTNAAKREVLSIKKEQENKLKHLKKLEAKKRTLNACFTGNVEEFGQSLNNDHQGDDDMDDETRYHLQRVFTPKETEEERLIRTGQMTPFGTVISNKVKPPKIIIPQNQLTEFDKFLLGEAENHQNKKMAKLPCKTSTSKSAKTSRFTNNLKPSNSHETELTASPSKSPSSMSSIVTKPSKSVKKKIKLGSKHATGMKRKTATCTLVRNYTSDPEMSDFENGEKDDSDRDYTSDKDEEYIPDEVSSDASDKDVSKKGKFILKKGKQKCWTGPVSLKKDKSFEDSSDSDSNLKKSPRKRQMKVVDDGCQKSYVKRIKLLEKSKLLQKHQKILESEDGVIDSDDENCAEFDGGFKVPSSLWNKLYSYQQTGVRWLWELHQQNCGGIVGDEMGLGKTIQMIVFLVGLKISNLHTDGDTYQGLGPVILVCPTTVMHQWVKEFFTWWPDFRVAVLHESGSFTGKKGDLVYIINKKSGILITSYAGVVLHQKQLLDCNWHYVILDEGHKIRNPDAQATLVAKQFRTQHRLILSGSPIQNNLKELWSLFDFVFPGKLGTLPVFMQQFSVPIVQGGYANASQVQVQTAYKCATILRDTIKPYLLRRMKADVKVSIQLPNKNEQVLFCQLTDDQTQLYKDYLGSAEVASIINARLQIFVGLINLRKICNHPDLFDGGPKIFKDTDISSLSEDMQFGYYKRSGKMIVVEALLRLWHQQGHRVLFFSQSRQLLNIMEKFVKSKNYTYMKMDGTTSISSRQPAISKFNSDPNIFVFLLTTRVGGIGVNLTGADRVVIYDPDWNPSTDAQARERSWRIGQEKQVTIYRLLTAGTIEEKIYHRQIFKQFVTNRVLKDPRQRRFFKSNDLYELFTFSEMGKQGTETSAIFAGTGSEVKPVKKPKVSTNKMGKWTKRLSPPPKLKDIEVSFSSEKQEKMKTLAKKLSMQLAESRLNGSEANNSTDLNSEDKQCGSNTISSNNKNLTDVPPIISKESCSSKTKNEIANASSENTGVRKRKTSLEKEKSHEKRPRKKWKSTMIEGERIKYLVKKDVFKSATETEKESVNDDYVLSKLFKKSGVHTALKHDAIVDASDPDYMLVEGEANRVAQQAVKVLKMSRRQCARAEEGIPTWTGANGGNKHKFGAKKKTSVIPNLPSSSPSASPAESSNPGPSGIIRKKSAVIGKNNNDSVSKSSDDIPSSSDLLAAIKQRKVIFGNDKNSDSSDEDSVPTIQIQNSTTEYDELLVDIRNFIAFQASVDGQATTDEILREFKHKLPLNQTAVFKSLLSKICDFSRRSSGDGIWILKGEFQ